MSENTEKAGGTRFSAGKPVATWAPWLGMQEVCRVSEMGAKKYAPFDWNQGQSFTTLLSCAMRHLAKAMRDPLARDAESGLLHIGHAAWNLLTLLDFVEQGRASELDDVSTWHGVTTAEKRAREQAQPEQARTVETPVGRIKVGTVPPWPGYGNNSAAEGGKPL